MKKCKNVSLAIVGVISIVLGIVCFSLGIGSKENNNAYGGDAYTGIQNAAAQTANNIMNVATICKVGFGSILLIAGGALISVSFSEEKTIANSFENSCSQNSDELPKL